MGNIINERIKKIRDLMKKHNMSIYLIPMSDFHSSEYLSEYFREILFMSNFSGSNAIVVITLDKAALWTDGRYFIQAERQMKDNEIHMYKMAVEGEPTVNEYIENNLKENTALGFDGRLITIANAKALEEICEKKKCTIEDKYDLPGEIWEDRPNLPNTKIWELPEKRAGKSRDKKLSDVREKMKEYESDGYLLTSLCDIAWLLNLRAFDIECTPVFLSYIYITKKDAFLYVNKEQIDSKIEKILSKSNIKIKGYDDIYSDLKNVKEKNILLDDSCVSFTLKNSFPSYVKFIYKENPTSLMKAIKNETEIKETKNAHVKDGVALTHFIYWLKKNIKDKTISELDVSDKLYELRSSQKDFVELSFNTIAAYEANAAMMHYTATKDNFSYIKNRGLLLVDSGGQYMDGTTDVTRTIALEDLTEDEKIDYTTVVRCHLRLMAAHFLKGNVGQNLDILARGPVWDRGLDYRCGTGHGVGHVSNVHEGPNAFRWNIKGNAISCIVPGMITSDEPGIYIENKYGIRIESEILCVEDIKTEYGQFYKFEPITYAPIDLKPIKKDMLTQYEVKTLNDYHKLVYEKLSPYFEGEELSWLKENTRAI